MKRREFLQLAAVAPLAWLAPRLIPTEPEGGISPLSLGNLRGPFPDGVLERVETDQPLYAMTIDDGLVRLAMYEMLKTLDEHHATFFLTGLAAIHRLEADLLQATARLGHEIAYHSIAHDQYQQSKEAWIADYQEWNEIMLDLLGEELYGQSVKPYARAPYGAFDKGFLEMCEELDLLPVAWSNDQGDLLRGYELEPGQIFLMHVRAPDYVILRTVIAGKLTDLTPVSLGELLAAAST